MSRHIFGLALVLTLTASVAFAGSPTLWGDYVETRSNHLLAGGCTYSAEAGSDANQAVLAWRVGSGDMAGLSVVAVILGKGNLQLGNHERETVLYIDEKATPAQQETLRQLFATRYAALFGTLKKVASTPIFFENDGSDRYAVHVPGQVEIATRTIRASDHEPACDRIVWYTPLSSDATASVVATSKHVYSGGDLGAIWNIPNKRSAYVGTFSFSPEMAVR
ncbi:MAG: DUF1326 domain-containing protein [candidate division Zixibacteria bacterium]|nr:DUF1326 domain-containing protein [candidate division Zixibacteria bacterium]